MGNKAEDRRAAKLAKELAERRETRRAMMLPVSSFISQIAITLSGVKGWLNKVPNLVVVVIWLASFAPITYWGFTHKRIATLRLWIRDKRATNPKITIVSVIVSGISLVAIFASAAYLVIGQALTSKDAKYVRPSNKLVRFEGNVNQFATPPQCAGLPEDKERECLCPRSLDYTLTALPTPNDNNYSTLLSIKAGSEDMYRVAIYGRTPMHSGKILEGLPNGPPKGSLVVTELAFDLYAMGLTSIGPEREFRMEIHTSEGLRLKCVNQIN
jgi:hypothetical protein